MALDLTSFRTGNIYLLNPQGEKINPGLLNFTQSGKGKYTFNKTWSFLDRGTWEIYTSSDKAVLNKANLPTEGDILLGAFEVTVPDYSGDITPPTAELVSITPSAITQAGGATIAIEVQFTDDDLPT